MCKVTGFQVVNIMHIAFSSQYLFVANSDDDHFVKRSLERMWNGIYEYVAAE